MSYNFAIHKALQTNATWLAERVAGDLLPKELLGCGHYGCVYATSRPEIVVKVTADPTEVAFIQAAMQLPWPEGIVRYSNLLAAPWVPEHDAPQIHFAWREAADKVGEVLAVSSTTKAVFRLGQFETAVHALRAILKHTKDAKELWRASKQFQTWAHSYVVVPATSDETDPRYRTAFPKPQLVAFLWRSCEVVAQHMASEPVLDRVGQALSYYLERGLLLTDVHAGNIGKITRDGCEVNVITDPGHATDLLHLDEETALEWKNCVIPELAFNVGFSGTQIGMTSAQQETVDRLIAAVIKQRALETDPSRVVFAHHGDCLGADSQFDEICRRHHVQIVLHPPILMAKRARCDQREPPCIVRAPLDYLERNKAIIHECSYLIATPKEAIEQVRSGTWATVRYARRAKRLLDVVLPDGSVATNESR